MRRSIATQAISLLLVLAFPLTTLMADAGGAMLRSDGGVMVNGKVAPSSTALFAGDKVSTGADGVANISAAGSILTVSPGTSLIYGTNTVEMACGEMAVTTLQRGLTTKVRNLQVSPAADDSTFEISHLAEKLAISVRSGSVLVNDGQQTMTLAAGKVMTFPSPGECSDPPKDTQKTQPAGRGFHMTNGKIALLAAAGAGAIAAGVVIAEHGNKHCISNDGSPACKCSNPNPNKCQ